MLHVEYGALLFAPVRSTLRLWKPVVKMCDVLSQVRVSLELLWFPACDLGLGKPRNVLLGGLAITSGLQQLCPLSSFVQLGCCVQCRVVFPSWIFSVICSSGHCSISDWLSWTARPTPTNPHLRQTESSEAVFRAFCVAPCQATLVEENISVVF